MRAVALQGPEAAEVLAGLIPESAELGFMTWARVEVDGHPVVVSRSGYTGEDGFELLIPPALIERFWTALTGDERVRPIGLGARDSLRLEAGLPLYGHDLDETTSPIEGALRFSRCPSAGARRPTFRARSGSCASGTES
jgi:aminomethyltransferase